MLAGHSAPDNTQSESLTRYSKRGRCWPITQRPGTTLHLGRIHLQATAAKAGSVSRSLSTQADSRTSCSSEGGEC